MIEANFVVQKLTAAFVKEVDDILAAKEKDLMEV
jgi:ribosome recycling factor